MYKNFTIAKHIELCSAWQSWIVVKLQQMFLSQMADTLDEHDTFFEACIYCEFQTTHIAYG